MVSLTQCMQPMSHNFSIEYNNPTSGKPLKKSDEIIEANASISEMCYKYNPANAFIKIKNGTFDLQFALHRFGYSMLRGITEVLEILNGHAESSKIYPNTVDWNPNTERFACFIVGEAVGEIPVFVFVIKDHNVRFYTRTLFAGKTTPPEIYPGRDSEQPVVINTNELKQNLQATAHSYLSDLENSFSNISNSKEFQSFRSIVS